MRVWLVTALDLKGHFVDQRRIEAHSQHLAEKWAHEWIKGVGGSVDNSKVKEVK